MKYLLLLLISFSAYADFINVGVVSSVNGESGEVVLDFNDIGAASSDFNDYALLGQASWASNDLVLIYDFSAMTVKKFSVSDLDTRYVLVSNFNSAFDAQLATKTVQGISGGSNLDNTSDANKPVSSAQQTALNLKADQSSLNTTNSNVSTNTSNIATNSTLIANKYFLPANVNFLSANKNFIQSSYDGLMIHSGDSVGDANPSGAYNGSGVGQKAWLGFTNYNNALLSSLTGLSFTAKNLIDNNGASHGNMYWNLYINFKTTGAVTASDYAGLIIDDTIRNRVGFYQLGANHTAYPFTTSDRLVKCVGGTGKLSGYATSVTGSNVINNVQNADQLTVGMYFRQIPTATAGTDTAVSNIPDGAKITAINTGTAQVTLDTNVTTGNSSAIANGSVNTTSGSATATQVTTTLWAVNQAITGSGIPVGTYVTVVTGTSTITMSQAATATALGVSLTRQAGFNYVQYGGVAPVNRTASVDGSTAVITSIVNTKDLLVGMQVTGTGIPANSFIVSLVANTSITINNNTTSAGSPTLSFLAVGKSGIPNNSDNFGIPMSVITANNPNTILTNTTPTVAGGWSSADNGAKLNTEHASISLTQGSSSIATARINFVKTVIINSDTYNF